MTDNKNLSKIKEDELKARLEQDNKIKGSPASDIYSNVEKDPETCVEIPTEEAVEEARDWISENSR